jgi:alpha,alpha-trehalase
MDPCRTLPAGFISGRPRRGLVQLIAALAIGVAVVLGQLGPVSRAAAFDTPYDLYGELFIDVQLSGLYPDSKTFADATPKRMPAEIVAAYRQERTAPNFSLRQFVDKYFTLPARPVVAPARLGDGAETTAQSAERYVDELWTTLTRQPKPVPAYSSLIVLPHAYVVPGGRFEELYYWDSYFTMLGLLTSGRDDLAVSMLRNFAWLIDRYGFVPNGTRTYYLSRSQPPMFALMVELLAAHAGKSVYVTYLPQLRREYEFWMEGAGELAVRSAQRHVVRLPDGALLNRYWDARDIPREESYREDVATARAASRPASEVYRELRAAAESGWDFSSRWLADGKSLATIRTSELIPPDLNSLLYQLERTIADGCAAGGDSACLRDMQARAAARKAAMLKYLWNPQARAFTDYLWRSGVKQRQVTAATLLPVYVGIASQPQAHAIAGVVRGQLLKRFGLATTATDTGQQWDAPNAWPPLQWFAIRGFPDYAEQALADAIAQRWMRATYQILARTGKFVEKHNVDTAAGGSGGEYGLQEGFGWTNGVFRKLLTLYPESAAERPRDVVPAVQR